jgi:gluconate 2-dehydrogenase gamma chain
MADEKSDEKYPGNITRRTVIATAATAAFVPVTAIRSAAQSIAPAARTFSPDQRRTLEAFIDRICPKDELGPGAVEIGAADYMEVQLGDYLKGEKQTFLDGLAAVDAYARANYGGPFADLSAENRDAVLTDIDSGKANDLRAFFTRARRLTLEGMFGDPHYGGNRNFAGWDLIKYPGPRLATTADMQKMNAPVEPYHRSAWGAADHNGH